MAQPAENTSSKDQSVAERNSITFRKFLEIIPPNAERSISKFWTHAIDQRYVNVPAISINCSACGGDRIFRSPEDSLVFSVSPVPRNVYLTYQCSNCKSRIKVISIRVVLASDGFGQVIKFGEFPAFGVPVSNKLLKLFGSADADLFQKGRQCENLGYGIGAFSYYRRVVENHRNDLFDEIIKVCQTLNGSEGLVEQLESAKTETSFSKSIDRIKVALPDGLLIEGHNPLKILHKALSVGLHSETDEDCLENAQSIRLVMVELVQRIKMIKSENKELNEAVHRLMK